MLVTPIEALAEAIASNTTYRDPASALYQTRNPGALRAFSQKRMQDSDKLRVFKTFTGGFNALVADLRIKCEGRSNSGLTVDSTLKELITVYQHPHSMTAYVVMFLRKALNDSSISEDTQLAFFLG